MIKNLRIRCNFYFPTRFAGEIDSAGPTPLLAVLDRLGGWPPLEGNAWESKFAFGEDTDSEDDKSEAEAEILGAMSSEKKKRLPLLKWDLSKLLAELHLFNSNELIIATVAVDETNSDHHIFTVLLFGSVRAVIALEVLVPCAHAAEEWRRRIQCIELRCPVCSAARRARVPAVQEPGVYAPAEVRVDSGGKPQAHREYHREYALGEAAPRREHERTQRAGSARSEPRGGR